MVDEPLNIDQDFALLLSRGYGFAADVRVAKHVTPVGQRNQAIDQVSEVGEARNHKIAQCLQVVGFAKRSPRQYQQTPDQLFRGLLTMLRGRFRDRSSRIQTCLPERTSRMAIDNHL